MAKHGQGHGADVVDAGVEAAVQHGPGFRPQHQILARPRPGAPTDIVANELAVAVASLCGPRQPHELHRVAHHVVGHRHAAHDLLQRQNLLARKRRRDRGRDVGRRAPHDVELLLFLGIIDVRVEHEAVELGLGQRVGALVLDRVLRGQHEERLRELMPLAAGGDLVLLHRLQQGRLGFRRRAVDLVGQDHVAEDRAFEKPELAAARAAVFLDHLGAGDVGGHQVGRELDAAELQREGSASVRIKSVLASPGTPTSRQCPRANMATSSSSITCRWPTITRPSCSVISR